METKKPPAPKSTTSSGRAGSRAGRSKKTPSGGLDRAEGADDVNGRSPANGDESSTDASTVVRFSVPGRPRTWERPRFSSKTRRTYDSPRYREAREAFALVARSAAPRSPATGPVEIEVSFLFPLPKKGREEGEPYTATPDIDNLEKLVLDALSGLFFADDRQVVRLVAVKRYAMTARTEVTIRWLGNG